MPTKFQLRWNRSKIKKFWHEGQRVFSVRYELRPKKQLSKNKKWDSFPYEIRAETEETVDYLKTKQKTKKRHNFPYEKRAETEETVDYLKTKQKNKKRDNFPYEIRAEAEEPAI